MEHHDTILRVRYSETDRMDVVYYSRYFEYFEVGRAEYMRACGTAYSDLEEQGIRLAVVEASAKYRAPARYDEEIRIRTRITDVKKTRVRFEYQVLNRETEELLAEGSTWLACIDGEGRPGRIPEKVLAAFSLGSGVADS
ncbi:MAG: acyl-CoA thioesterase [Planctomycetota bacterium]